MDISTVNALGFEEFISLLGGVVEHFPTLAAGVWSHRPYRDVHHLHRQLCALVDQLPFEVKEGILRVHPDLAGKLADSEALTKESTNEQQSAGLLTLTAEEKTYLKTHNQSYKAKFGFPFVICARQNKKESIMRGIKDRYDQDKKEETLFAVNEVKKIAYFRMCDIISHNKNDANQAEYLSKI